jgi:hypothetical protein
MAGFYLFPADFGIVRGLISGIMGSLIEEDIREQRLKISKIRNKGSIFVS